MQGTLLGGGKTLVYASLGFRFSHLDAIHSSSPCECLREMLAIWLRQCYKVRRTLALCLPCLIIPGALAWHLQGQGWNLLLS